MDTVDLIGSIVFLVAGILSICNESIQLAKSVLEFKKAKNTNTEEPNDSGE